MKGLKTDRTVQRKPKEAESGREPPRAESAGTLLGAVPYFSAEGAGQVQTRADGPASEGGSEGIHSAAEAGVSGPGGALPHQDRIQASFGSHDVSAISAHIGGRAADASRAIGASAYATGGDVAFASQPDLHTAAHEAAHVVQQRGGVSLLGGVGQAGDAHEQHADAVADAVVRGQSAEPLLDSYSGGAAGVQRQAVQMTVAEVSAEQQGAGAGEVRTLAEGLCDIAGTAGAADKNVVVTELLKMPRASLERLRDQGTRVVVCQNSITQVKPELAGVVPRGWEATGLTWDSVPGQYDVGGNRVIIATRGGRVPPTGDGHGAHNLVLHECAHALDRNGQFSNTPEFQAARNPDVGTLSGYETQAGGPGREETYAESFARYYGEDANDQAQHPNLHQYWAGNPLTPPTERLRAEIKEAVRSGGDDDYVREKITEAHLRIATAQDKAAMIVNLLDGYTGDDDEQMILRILGSADPNGTLAALKTMGRLEQLFDDMHGEEYDQLMQIDATEIKRHQRETGG